MPLRVSGKNLDIGEALRQRVESRLSDLLAKYYEGGWSGHVTVEKEGFGFRAESSLHLDSGITLQADATSGDAYASVDEVATRIEKRLRRYKRKLRDKHGPRAVAAADLVHAPSYVVTAPEPDSEEELHEFHPVVVAESTTRFDTLTVADAVMRLDLTGYPVVVFRHAGNGRVNVVYRRVDGHVGWIDPPTGNEQKH